MGSHAASCPTAPFLLPHGPASPTSWRPDLLGSPPPGWGISGCGIGEPRYTRSHEQHWQEAIAPQAWHCPASVGQGLQPQSSHGWGPRGSRQGPSGDCSARAGDELGSSIPGHGAHTGWLGQDITLWTLVPTMLGHWGLPVHPAWGNATPPPPSPSQPGSGRNFPFPNGG